MLNNKWLHGNVTFEFPDLHPRILSSFGIKPVPFVLDPDVGQEIVLFITERNQNMHEFQERDNLRLETKAGLVNTSYGPVMFLLFIIPDPIDGNDVVHENSIDPTNPAQLATYWKLSNQQYWHLIMMDNQANVHNFYEFENQYGLGHTLSQVQDVVKDMRSIDFLAAKAEYESKYSVAQLLSL